MDCGSPEKCSSTTMFKRFGGEEWIKQQATVKIGAEQNFVA
jgi:hypothetical protein